MALATTEKYVARVDLRARLTAALADRYRIDREAGAGGMATVFEAHDLRHERQVAIKVLHEDLGATLGPGRFITEIKTTARLQHPHILPLLDSGEVQGLLFYVMPFVTGETLRDRLVRDTLLPIDEAVQVAREVADALGYAHGLGIVHRDIKPENILLQGGHAVVADFGIALAVQQAGGARMTQTGLSLGTPQYMSPEQAMGEKTVDFHADIYALGAVTYEMLTGEPPFTGATVQAIVAKVLTERPIAPTTLRDTVPANVERAVLKALAKLPADRQKSAEEFARVLGEAATSGAIGMSGGRPGPARKTRGRDVMLVAGAVAVAVLSTAFAMQSTTGASDHAVRRIRLDLPEATSTNVYQNARSVGISSNGEIIAYDGIAPDGSVRIYIRRWNSLDATAVPGSTGGFEPTFSPNGDSIAFLLAPHRVKVVPLAGGVPVIVADSGLYGLTDGISGLDWGTDGKLYVTAQAGLATVRPGENQLRRVSILDTKRGDFAHLFPRRLPNGKGALVTVATNATFASTPDSLSVGVVDLATGRTSVVLRGFRPQYSATGHIVYLRPDGVVMAAPFDQDRLAVTGSAVELRDTVMVTVNGAFVADMTLSTSGTLFYTKLGALTYRATWVDRAGTPTVMRQDLAGGHAGLTISPDGSRVAMSIDNDLWMVPFDKSPPLRLTAGALVPNSRATWTPDGKTIYFVGYRGEQVFSTVLRVNVGEGSQPQEVPLGDKRQMFGVTISPDGKWLLMRTDNQAPGAGDILGMRLGVDTVPRVLVASRFEDLSPSVSPDGKWLAYSSNESGRHEIYVRPFPETNDAKYQVSMDGGIEPRWAPSGRELFFRSAKDKLVSVPVTPGPTFIKGTPVELFDVSGYQAQIYSQAYDVSPDGKRFLMLRIMGKPRPASVVVFNFGEELKSIAKGGKP